MDILQAASPSDFLYRRVSRVIPPFERPLFEADVEAILRLKAERKAIILAHNYQSPEIFHCVADVVGDSLALAREAAKNDARVIVMAGVHFMAETAKLLNPSKTVLIPDPEAE
jgi:quinolinate synthase